MSESRGEYDETYKKQRYDMDKRNKETQGGRLQFESDVRNFESEQQKEAQECYSNTMYLQKGGATANLATERFERDVKLLNEMLKAKQDELEGIMGEREKLNQEFMAMKDLQEQIDKEKRYAKEIEEMHVELQFLAIKVSEMETATEQLQDKKE